MNVTISSGSGANSALGKGCATIFLSVFAIVGLAVAYFIVKSGFDSMRLYFWSRTDCTIESAAVSEKGNGFEFSVSYSYRHEGRTYTGTTLRMGMWRQSMDGEDAQRAAQRYAAGSRAVCYVNPSSPTESTLERASLWPLLLLFFPLIFLTIGVGGIIAVWRGKPAAAKPISERHGAKRGAAIVFRVLGFIFMGVGAGVLYVMFFRPMLKEAAAAKWPQVPCEILFSQVGSHRGSKGGYTYSVEIRYRYNFGGRAYTGTRYDFTTGSSSGRQWREEAVAKFPQGLKTLCHVNPEDPVEAVLSVKPSPDRWFGLLPGIFLIVGLLIFITAPKMAGGAKSRAGLPADTLPLLPRDAATGEVELKPATSPMTGCIVMLLVALFWNGITWGVLLTVGKGALAAKIFLGLFALIGAALFAGVIHQFLALFNPRPVLTVSAGAVPLGGKLDVRWRFTGNARRLARLAIWLEAREEATYRRGTTTTTDKNVFAILALADTTDRAAMAGGSASITIPRELIHTFTAPNNKIVWTLRVTGDIPRWPDVSAEFPIIVLPRNVSTLFHEENPTS